MAKKSKQNQNKKNTKALKRRKKHLLWKKTRNRLKFAASFRLKRQEIIRARKEAKHHLPIKIQLPKIFSFIKNPTEVLDFFHRIQRYLKNKVQIVLDFENVEAITPDVLALMMAKFSNPRFTYGTTAWLNKPLQPHLNKLLLDSGFYRLMKISKDSPTQGLLNTLTNTVVDTDLASNARMFTAQKTFGDNRMIQPLYRTLIECMANTRKHASGEQASKETWWLAVYNDPETKVTSFSFCDTGVGIFKSSKIKVLTKLAVKLGFAKNSSILLNILEGKMQSSTGLHYRGKGLPKIYSDYQKTHLKRLCIAANDVFSDFDTGTFIELKHTLNGTFLYWEIHP